ncbi:DUF881 domain-containing protein [Oerskovia sp. Sa1BUA8]|uniref:DUF881 domain-containing protein n=2 Tax=Oerskovia douganii TaxID=2762210 RepID=A0A9D5YZY3_9CELL|nr:DUF881 domain-containing protein [Oerskovia douganii]
MTHDTRNEAPSASRHRRPPLDASMTLLTEVMDRPLDPGYAEAAARRTTGQEPPRRTGTWVFVAVLAVALGFVTAAATIDLRAPQGAAIEARKVLEKEILDRREQVDALSAQATAVSDEIETLQTEALADVDPALLETLQIDGVASGSLAVTGPGLVLTLQDAPAGVGADDQSLNEKVQDSDLQRVVNALWASGAEAIAINGQRLTPLSAIRSAGEAILVDLQPLIGPYRVEAIGDPATLETEFARSDAPGYLSILSSKWGIQSSRISQGKLSLPGDGIQRLFYAQAVDSTATTGDEPGVPTGQDSPSTQGSESLRSSTGPAGADSSLAGQESTE